MHKKTNKLYCELFIAFIDSEIPNILQILMVFGFLSFLLDKLIYRIIISLLVIYLVSRYISVKMIFFLENQLINKFSRVNLRNLNHNELIKKWKIYMTVSSFISGLIIGSLSEILVLF